MAAPRAPLYLDNAATSFPKPQQVWDAMARYMNHVGASPGRGAYGQAIEAGRIFNRCRELINRLVGGASPNHIVFTLNASDALNLAIKGLVAHHRIRTQSVHIITTDMDHNSILRPLNAIRNAAVEVTHVQADPRTGKVNVNDVRSAVRTDTKLLAILHASNVTGTLQGVSALGELCKAHNIVFLLDAAQTLGHVPIDVQQMNIDLLAFPGHKGLLGPLGTGGLYLRPGMEDRIEPLREGGTGSQSELDVQPKHLPDKYEPGSMNGPGVAGLAAGVEWILEKGVDELWRHEQHAMQVMLEGLMNVPGLRLLGLNESEGRCGVFSFVVDGWEPLDLAGALEAQFGVLVRAGLHCAPLAHKALGTSEGGGAVRMSLGPFVSLDDAQYAVECVAELAEGSREANRQRPHAGQSSKPIANRR